MNKDSLMCIIDNNDKIIGVYNIERIHLAKILKGSEYLIRDFTKTIKDSRCKCQTSLLKFYRRKR